MVTLISRRMANLLGKAESRSGATRAVENTREIRPFFAACPSRISARPVRSAVQVVRTFRSAGSAALVVRTFRSAPNARSPPAGLKARTTRAFEVANDRQHRLVQPRVGGQDGTRTR